MENTLHLPKHYSPMSEQEMTYASGGGALDGLMPGAYAIGGVAGMVVGGLLIYNFVDCLIDARSWYKANKTGDLGDDLGNGVNALGDYITSSAWNCVRGVLVAMSAFISAGLVVSAVAAVTA